MTDTSPDTILALSIIKLITVAMGFTIIYLGAKAYRASRRRPILFLTIAMAIMTLGVISEGVAFQGLGWSLDQSHIVEGVVTLVAFAVLVYSLYS